MVHFALTAGSPFSANVCEYFAVYEDQQHEA